MKENHLKNEYLLRRKAWYGDLPAIKNLIKDGANPFARDKECWFANQTALEVAERAGHQDVILYLEKLKSQTANQ